MHKIGYLFKWREWSSKHRKHFLMNIFVGFSIAILFHFVPNTRFGQTIQNFTYDYLVRKDFQKAVFTQNKAAMISDKIRLVQFDFETYANSPGKYFWTPRDILGECIYKAVLFGAKVVIVDISVHEQVPVYFNDNKIINENDEFLKYLNMAGKVAKKNDAAIIFPQLDGEKPIEDFFSEMDGYNEIKGVFVKGFSSVYLNPVDHMVRHFKFFDRDEKTQEPVFSLPVLGALYYWHGRQQGNYLLQQKKLELLNSNNSAEIEIPSDGTVRNLSIYQQSSVEDCKDARIKFRLVPREIVTLIKGEDLLFDISVRPAALVAADVNSNRFKDKIVIIGSTCRLAGDYHFTPVGEIPGVLIVTNILNMFLMNSQIHESNLLVYILEAITIVFSAWIFTFLSPLPAAIAMAGIFLLIVTPVSLFMFSRWGLFLDFWLPVVGIAIDKNISSLEDVIGKHYLKTRGEK